MLSMKPGRYRPLLPPSRHQRKPSITPTMGLRLYQKRKAGGTTPLEKPTGDTYSPNWTMNGIMNRKSRYLTFRAVIRSAGPRLANTARTTNAGNRRICQVGAKPYQSISTNSIARLTAKSTSATTADEEG